VRVIKGFPPKTLIIFDALETAGTMPSFMMRKHFFEQYRSGKKDIELRSVKPQWKNGKIGDVAVLLCGRSILRKRITEIHKGSLARIFIDVDYKRIFPEAKTIFKAVGATRRIYPRDIEFMAFELG
jgi:ASC-1-like (ASCH) protein